MLGSCGFEPRGNGASNTLDPSGLDELEEWIASVRRFWPRRLDALERELRKPRRKQR
jgi:hypothetical protein